MEAVKNTMKKVEKVAWVTAAGSFAIDLLTALDTSGLTGVALVTGLTSLGLRTLFRGSAPAGSK